ncbi:MAG TPA: ATP-binding protein [Planctomycetota bacterium]|nr:ATP-binding protein [Planctomycetota bacterium]
MTSRNQDRDTGTRRRAAVSSTTPRRPRGVESTARLFFEGAPEGAVILDAAGVVVAANAAFLEILGTTAERVLGRSPADWTGPAARRAFLELLDPPPGGRRRGKVALRRADGGETPALISTIGLEDDDARRIFVIVARVASKNVADPHDAHEEPAVLRARLDAAAAELAAARETSAERERMAALGRMTSGIAHDLNNALAPIVGYAELLLEGPSPLAPEVRADLEVIHTAACDAAATVRRLREFYRGQGRPAPEAVDLADVVEHVVALAQPSWRDQALAGGAVIRVVKDLAPGVLVSGYASELREALLNLVLNAVDAMPHGGTLTVRTAFDDGRPVLEVSDEGVGMTAEQRRRCFEPYFTTKGHGSGLGLSLVKSIVRRHDGVVDVAGAPGCGSTFRVTFPAPADAVPTTPPHADPSQAPLHALVVDDEPASLAVVTRFLALDGHTFETATDGDDALRRFRGGRFDLLVTDATMPGLSGEQLAEAVRREAPSTPIVLVSGFGAASSGRARPSVADVRLAKPITLAAWRSALASLGRAAHA